VSQHCGGQHGPGVVMIDPPFDVDVSMDVDTLPDTSMPVNMTW
jgi:hypothetical protein